MILYLRNFEALLLPFWAYGYHVYWLLNYNQLATNPCRCERSQLVPAWEVLYNLDLLSSGQNQLIKGTKGQRVR